jgi:hypothetical protein
MTKQELLTSLNEVLKPINEHLSNLDRQVTELWSKVIQMQFDIARIRAGIPGRTYVDLLTSDNDEAKKLSDDIGNSITPTKKCGCKVPCRCLQCY